MAEGAPLVVASYNVHSWVGGDGRVDEERWERVLGELDADLLALQEVEWARRDATGRPLLDRLAQRLDYRVLRGPTYETRHYGNALLTRYEVPRVSKLDLSVAGREPRGALDVEVDIGSERLRVVATHLGLGLWERRIQVSRLLAALAGGRRAPVVVLGDMNEWVRGAGALWRLHRRLGRAAAPRTFPARRPLLPLDRIWVHPRSRLRALRVHRTPLARVASDHLPVCAEIARPGNGG